MRIVVMIKQVPNTTKVRLDPVTNNLIRDGVESILNPYDAYALENALQIKERIEDCQVEVFSMGPQAAADILKYAFSMGADKGTLLSDRAFAGSDTLATSYILSQAAAKEGIPDLIICGKQAIDGDTAQVPEEIAGHLGIPCLTNVLKIGQVRKDSATVVRKTDYCSLEMQVTYPAVLTVDKGYVDPRMPMLKDIIRAKYKDMTVWDAEKLGADAARMSIQGSPTQVEKVFSPDNKKEARMLSGTLEEQLDQALVILRERGIDLTAKCGKESRSCQG